MMFKIIAMDSHKPNKILQLEKHVNDFIKDKKNITIDITTIPWKINTETGAYTHVFITYEE